MMLTEREITMLGIVRTQRELNDEGYHYRPGFKRQEVHRLAFVRELYRDGRLNEGIEDEPVTPAETSLWDRYWFELWAVVLAVAVVLVLLAVGGGR